MYSTTATGDALAIVGSGVENVADERHTDSTTTMPQSILDVNDCWTLLLAPDSPDMLYHAKAYATTGAGTTYGDQKGVRLSELEGGVSLAANMGGLSPEDDLDGALEGLSEGVRAITFDANGGVGEAVSQAFLAGQPVMLRRDAFTREGYGFDCWNTKKNGDGTAYADGQSVNLGTSQKGLPLSAHPTGTTSKFHPVHKPSRKGPHRVHFRPVCVRGGVNILPKSVRVKFLILSGRHADGLGGPRWAGSDPLQAAGQVGGNARYGTVRPRPLVRTRHCSLMRLRRVICEWNSKPQSIAVIVKYIYEKMSDKTKVHRLRGYACTELR